MDRNTWLSSEQALHRRICIYKESKGSAAGEDLQSWPHAASVSWKVRKVRNDDAVVERVVAFEAHALTTTSRCYIDDGAVIDTEVYLVADGPGETQRCCFTLGDVASAATSILVMALDEVKRFEKVGCVELLVKLVSLSGAEGKKGIEKVLRERHGCGDW